MEERRDVHAILDSVERDFPERAYTVLRLRRRVDAGDVATLAVVEVYGETGDAEDLWESAEVCAPLSTLEPCQPQGFELVLCEVGQPPRRQAFHNICMMREYMHASPEELRALYYGAYNAFPLSTPSRG